VTAAPDDLEGEVVAVGLDPLQDRQRDVEVVGAEQQPGRRLQPLTGKGTAQQDLPGRLEVVPVQP
jgi:hypothetical protein